MNSDENEDMISIESNNVTSETFLNTLHSVNECNLPLYEEVLGEKLLLSNKTNEVKGQLELNTMLEIKNGMYGSSY